MPGTKAQVIQVIFDPVSDEESDLLTALLMDLGFQGFALEEGSFSAFIPAEAFHREDLEKRLEPLPFPARFRERDLPDRNWNEEWERHYEPVLVEGKVFVRAPFHPPAESIGYDLIIEPKMSFGTAHHETTTLMIAWLLEETPEGEEVLDMGTGTGILAILAARMGAREVTAIDNDEWAVANARENCERNQVPGIRVIQGGKEAVPDHPFGLVLANINRNTLLDQIPAFAVVVAPGGRMILSGFYEEDLKLITGISLRYGFRSAGVKIRNHWASAKFTR